jgi:hypothetical protein
MNKIQQLSNSSSSETLLSKAYFYLGLIAFMGFTVIINHTKMTENDTWWHLAMGRWMVKNHQVYRTEIFSQPGLGRPFIAHEWLSEVLFYLFFDKTGTLLCLFKLSLVVSCCLIFVYCLAKPYWNGSLTYPISVALVFLVNFRASVRPQIFEIYCTAIFILILHFWQEKPQMKRLLWLFPVQIFWANAHGSYLLGPALIFLLALSLVISAQFKLFPGDKLENLPKQPILPLFSVGFGLIVISLLNPFHWHLLIKSFSVFFLDNYIKEYIREWWSVFKVEKGYWFYVWVGWIIWGWSSLWRLRKKATQIELGVMILATLFPIFAVRYLTFSAMISFPHLLKRSFELYPTGFKPAITSLILIPLIVLIYLFGCPVSGKDVTPIGTGFEYGVVPTDIIQHIKANHLKGVIMNHYHDGAFFIYYTYPDVLPVMDSRTDFYGKDLFMEYSLAFTSHELFEEYVKKHHVNLVIARLIPETENLRQYLFSSPDWNFEKMGIDNILFSKVTTDHPRLSREKLQETFLSYQTTLNPSEPLPDPKTSYCSFVRVLGHCELAPECDKICRMSDLELTNEMRLHQPYCLKFSQACFQSVMACGGCLNYCRQYHRVIDQINTLGFHYPRSETCER